MREQYVGATLTYFLTTFPRFPTTMFVIACSINRCDRKALETRLAMFIVSYTGRVLPVRPVKLENQVVCSLQQSKSLNIISIKY